MSKDKLKFIVRAKPNDLAVASVQLEGQLSDGSVICFQVVGFNCHEEFCQALEKMFEMQDNSDTYWHKKRFECGILTLVKFDGPMCSIIVNDCRVVYHGYTNRLRGLEKAIRKAYKKSCDAIDKE